MLIGPLLMEYFKLTRCLNFLFLVIILITLFFPQLSSALEALNDDGLTDSSPSLVNNESNLKNDSSLQPINENQLDEMSPSLIAPPVIKSSPPELQNKMDQEFANSVCFKQCHKSGDFYPSDNTAKQWQLLIGQDGHAIFSDIEWKSPQQKKDILDYLLKNSKQTRPESAGIGVW
jgi:hypothetical protein